MNLLSYTPTKPFEFTAGPKTPGKVLVVGEAWGESEEKFKQPFCGYTGKELFRMLFEAMPEVDPELQAQCLGQMLGDGWIYLRDKWLEKTGITLTNTFALRPIANNLKTICISTREFKNAYPGRRPLSPLAKGDLLRPEYYPELERLKAEIEFLKPNLILALGATACWALLDFTKIGAIRGTVRESTLCPGRKVLATYHPSAVCRNWAYRPIVIADLMKAKREQKFPEIRRPKREILINPTLSDIEGFFKLPAIYYAVDIETVNRQIEMISFARSRTHSLVVPFVDFSKQNNSYWRDEMEEICALDLIDEAMQSDVIKIFQNGLFDLQHLLPLGLKIRNATEDTMLLSHSLYPEMQKGLGFLGSIHTDEPAWKLQRGHSETEDLKRDE